MKKTSILSVIILTLFCFSCSVKITSTGLYSHYNKTKSKNPQLFVKPNATESICTLENTKEPKVYVINGKSLKECIQNKDALVYIWSPHCKSDVCYPLHIIQKKCDTNNIDLFIVAEYYDSELMQKSYKIKRPIFGIDTQHYKANVISKYIARFNFDLVGKKTEDTGRFIYFEKGIFKKSYRSLEDVINR